MRNGRAVRQEGLGFFFVYLFGDLECAGPFFADAAHIVCLVPNPESCHSKHVRYQLLATHLPLATISRILSGAVESEAKFLND
jgi:hypothetical protein